MSALRKLRQLKQNADAAAAPPASTASVPEEVAPTVETKKTNAFEMLMQEEEEEDVEEDVAATEQSEQAKPSESPAKSDSPVRPVAAARDAEEDDAEADVANLRLSASKKEPKFKKQASKFKSGNTKKASSTAASASSAAAAVPEKEDWELEFAPPSSADAAASSSGAAASSSSTSSSAASSSGLWSHLSTSSRLLDAAQEIRAVFGGRMERGMGGGAGGGNQEEQHHGPNRGGFRRGGAQSRRQLGGGISARASAASKRMLVRPNPNWPRTEEKGLLKMEFVPKMALPKESKPSKTAPAAGLHGNIHSLSTPPASDAAAAAEEQKDAGISKEYALQLARFQTQQLLALTPGARQYSFVHSRDFERIQLEYLSTVASHDVQALSYFSRQHPFHPEAALTMADIFAAQSEYSTAHEFVQRVLHVFENAFSPEFVQAVAEGNARMDGAVEQNGPFFTALAKHAQTLGKKGCPRTALEVCKLVLSLSPLVDHTGALFAIDYYAIRAKQYRFLVDFSRDMDCAVMAAYGVGAHPWAVASPAAASPALSSASSSSWTQPIPRAPCTFLPNLMYSRALAAFLLETEPPAADEKEKAKSKASASSSASTTAAMYNGVVSPPSLPIASAGGHSMLDSEADAAAFQASEAQPQSASYLLQQALLMWPSVLKPLLEQAGLESAVSRSGGAWDQGIQALNGLYSGGSFFSLGNPTSTPYLAKLEMIYAERCGALWKADKVISFLLSNVEALTKRIVKDGMYKDEKLMEKFVVARQRFLLSLPFPQVVKSLQKSSYTDTVPHLPPEMLMAQNHMQFDAAGERARQRAAMMREEGMQELDVHQHPMRVFLQSLLPWFVAPDGQAHQGGGAGGAADLGPQNIDEMVERIEAMPAEQREAMLRGLMAQAGEAEQAEMAAAFDLEAGDEAAPADDPYANYQFSSDEEEQSPQQQQQQ